MCLSPIYIDNVNRNKISQRSGHAVYSDVSSRMLRVPCGRCPVCIALKQSYLVQRVQMECLDNLVFFGTLTYNAETLPALDVNGFRLPYADISHWQNMMKNLRKSGVVPRGCRYFVCSEFGSKRHRPHFHFLLFYPKCLVNSDYRRITFAECYSLQEILHDAFLKNWRHNVGSTRSPVWVNNCTYKCVGKFRNFDCQFVDTISALPDDVAYYVTKYVCKASDYVDRLKSALYYNLPEKEFVDTWKKIRPRMLFSKGFGNPCSPLVVEHIQRGIRIALDDPAALYPYYFNVKDGSTWPLSPYYRRRFLSVDDELLFRSRGDSADGDFGDRVTLDNNDLTSYEISQAFARQVKTNKLISSRDDDGNFFDYLDLENNVNFIDSIVDYGNECKQNLLSDLVPDCWSSSLDFDDDLPQ